MSEVLPDDAGARPLEATAYLVERARVSSEASFQALYERLAPMLFAWVSLRVRPSLRSRVDAQDVIQEVWCRALRSFATFDPARASFRTWILGIAKNVLLEALRSVDREELLDPASGSSSRYVPTEVSAGVTSISQRLAEDEAMREFLAYAATLDADDRRVLVWCGLEEAAASDVALRLGISVAAVTKRWQRLRAKLAASALVKTLLIGDA